MTGVQTCALPIYFHPTRIGHGVRSIEDPTLIRYLREEHILLEICPTSNLQTNMYPDLAHHPVDRLYKLKVPVNISTDCRTISNTTLNEEYELLEKQFHWTKADFLACNLAAIDHAFTTTEIKTHLKTELIRAYSEPAETITPAHPPLPETPISATAYTHKE